MASCVALCSFEGSRERSRHVSGGYGEGETPLPIPNRAVKPLSADGTWLARAWESRSPPVYLHTQSLDGPAETRALLRFRSRPRPRRYRPCVRSMAAQLSTGAIARAVRLSVCGAAVAGGALWLGLGRSAAADSTAHCAPAAAHVLAADALVEVYT